MAGGFAIGHAVSLVVSPLREARRPGWLLGGIVVCGAILTYFSATHFGLKSVFATLSVGIAIRRTDTRAAEVLRESMRKLWGVAEIFLFAGIGGMLALSSLTRPSLLLGFLVLLGTALGFRIVVAWFCTVWTDMRRRERFYISLAQIPKATVQAVFGPVVFHQLSSSAVGLPDEGQMLLLMAVLAILASAPIGAVVLDRWGARLLPKDSPP